MVVLSLGNKETLDGIFENATDMIIKRIDDLSDDKIKTMNITQSAESFSSFDMPTAIELAREELTIKYLNNQCLLGIFCFGSPQVIKALISAQDKFALVPMQEPATGFDSSYNKFLLQTVLTDYNDTILLDEAERQISFLSTFFDEVNEKIKNHKKTLFETYRIQLEEKKKNLLEAEEEKKELEIKAQQLTKELKKRLTQKPQPNPVDEMFTF